MPPQSFAALLILVIAAAGTSILLVWLLPVAWALPALAAAALLARFAVFFWRR